MSRAGGLRSAVEHVGVALAYAIGTVGLTYPALLAPTSRIPGKGDAPWFLWDLWWFRHAIVDRA